jgi:hypothetical protein
MRGASACFFNPGRSAAETVSCGDGWDVVYGCGDVVGASCEREIRVGS